MEFIGRWFTASNSDGGATAMPGFKFPKMAEPGPERKKTQGPRTRSRFGGGTGNQNMFKQAADTVRKTLLGM